MDTFRGQMLFSLIRETIQNSMDARVETTAPVHVAFKLENVSKDSATGIPELLKYLNLASETSKKQHGNKSDAFNFYQRAIEKVESKSNFPVLAIHDSNTTGLTGPIRSNSISGGTGQWLALVKGSGLSIKQSDAALGSFGHGSKAPLSVSELRSVFYFTKIRNETGDFETRFQGKSILQSMETNDGDMTQGTGYFGTREKLLPLLNRDIPNWPISLRKDIFEGTGTSIYIPFPDLPKDKDDLWRRVEISVLTNFCYAIVKGNLLVTINDKMISKENVFEVLNEILEPSFLESMEDAEEILEDLQTAITIFKPDDGLSGEYILNGFGKVEWFMRVGNELNRRCVGIARQNGMLISRKAPGLERFQGTKPFDLFLCVVGEPGSGILRAAENPAHTNFEFDRIKNTDDRARHQSTYRKFVKDIREFINEKAILDTEHEQFVDDLDEFFEAFNEGNSSNLGKEMSNRLLIKTGTVSRRDSKAVNTSEIGDGNSRGFGTKPNGTVGGNSGFHAGSDDGENKEIRKLRIENQRITKIANSTNSYALYFDSPIAGEFQVKLLRIGQTEEVLSQSAENKAPVRQEVASAKKGDRLRIDFTLDTNEQYFAHELVGYVQE